MDAMKLRLALFVLWLACSLSGYAQADTRPVIGVPPFSCDIESPYTRFVTEKVVEMLTNTRRFRVVDRTSLDNVKAELELQKQEEFIDSENLVEQGKLYGAEKIISGHVAKIPIYRMKNADGSVRGFKGSVAFQMKIVDVATGLSSEATSFQGKTSKECLSPQAAVVDAMESLKDEIYEYFRVNFPLTAPVVRLLNDETIFLSAGRSQGLKVGDKLEIETIEMLGGKPYPSKVGEAKVKKLAGDDFAECEVSKKTAGTVKSCLSTNATIRCSLIIKK
jgi:hypothetical protein